ncbi:MAG: M48 family metalloprotease [Deltaproteobacteria bacterium]|nr:M48 family metalloprotease [Deltaproteobacteria bacterium]
MKTISRRKFIGLGGKLAFLGLGLSPVLTGFLHGCKIQVGSVQVDTDSVVKSYQAVSKSFEDITPEQEYYIGRTVGARILQKYKPYDNPAANRYINTLGQTLAQASDFPETYGGYHFLIQDSDDINAFAAPGGFIFVTRGILRCCEHEDAVAAVLAHEIGHVQSRHGLQAIKKSRVTDAVTILAIEGTKTFGGEDLANLTQTFEDSISDITSTLVVNGYSRAFEYQADSGAVNILYRVGYSPSGLVDMLRVMDKRLKPGGNDFVKTHPSPEKRISEIETFLSYSEVKSPLPRQARFKRYLGSV